MENTEILINVLEHLDVKNLLRCQLVHSRWNDLIRSIPSLQKAIFMMPDCSAGETDLKANPLLVQAFPTCFPDKERPASNQCPARSSDVVRTDLSEIRPAQQQAKGFRDASWRGMFTHAPPVKRLGIVRMVHAQGGDGVSQGLRRFNGNATDEGLRMGQLHDLMISMLEAPGMTSWPTIKVVTGRCDSIDTRTHESPDTAQAPSDRDFFLRLSLMRVRSCIRPSVEKAQEYRACVSRIRSEAFLAPTMELRTLDLPRRGARWDINKAWWRKSLSIAAELPRYRDDVNWLTWRH